MTSSRQNVHLALLGLFFFLLSLQLPILSHCQSNNNDPSLPPPAPNPRLERAYIALQALKHSITSDPNNLTFNWYGPDVCNYTGVFCAPAPDDPHIETVAGLDLNHGNISGTLPEDLGLLSDLALLHLNSNRFRGPLPVSLRELRLLYELDVSNNRLDGPFPSVVLRLPSLKYLHLRFNSFTGRVPDEVFDLKLDALFLNDNEFEFAIPENMGNSTVSALVLANAGLTGCLPRSIANMAETLEEIVILNNNITGCLPPEIAALKKLRVFDVSFNGIVGGLPEGMGEMKKLERLDVAHNGLSGDVPEAVCELPRLKNFTYSYNFFYGEPMQCLKIRRVDDRENCIPYRPDQRSERECEEFLSRPVQCEAFGCLLPLPPLPPPMHYSPPPYY